MELAPWGSFGLAAVTGVVLLLTNPVFYLALAFMAWDRTRIAKFERRFFGVRVTKAWHPVIRRLLLGIFVGLVASLVMLALGTVIHEREVFVLSGLTVLLALIRFRFSASGYSLAVLLALTLIGKAVHWGSSGQPLHALGSFVTGFHVDSWLAVAAVLFLAEAVLLAFHKQEHFAPAVVMSKRGRAIGAAVVQLPFLIPVLSFSPGHYTVPAGLPAGWPWVGTMPHGYSLVGLPLLAGFSAVLMAVRPAEAIRLTSRVSLLMGIVLVLDALAVHFWGAGFGWLGVVAMVLGRELPVWLIRQHENQNDPLFSPSKDGVRILTTREGSLAETMGLVPAEVVTHVNQVPVHSNYDLHFAFDQNPAYAKLQVIDERGEMRIVGKPVYTGELNQLGLVLAPDQPFGPCYRKSEFGLFQTLYLRIATPPSSLEYRPDDATLQS